MPSEYVGFVSAISTSIALQSISVAYRHFVREGISAPPSPGSSLSPLLYLQVVPARYQPKPGSQHATCGSHQLKNARAEQRVSRLVKDNRMITVQQPTVLHKRPINISFSSCQEELTLHGHNEVAARCMPSWIRKFGNNSLC